VEVVCTSQSGTDDSSTPRRRCGSDMSSFAKPKDLINCRTSGLLMFGWAEKFELLGSRKAGRLQPSLDRLQLPLDQLQLAELEQERQMIRVVGGVAPK
jgi:hypothetical protein